MSKAKEVAAAVESDGTLYVFLVDGRVVVGRLDPDGIAWEKQEDGEGIVVPGTPADDGTARFGWA